MRPERRHVAGSPMHVNDSNPCPRRNDVTYASTGRVALRTIQGAPFNVGEQGASWWAG
jgi:hypothetical protein